MPSETKNAVKEKLKKGESVIGIVISVNSVEVAAQAQSETDRVHTLLAALSFALPAPVTMTPIAAGTWPCGNTYAFGAVWVGALGSDALYRIDPKRNKATARARVGHQPCGVTAGAGSLWVEELENGAGCAFVFELAWQRTGSRAKRGTLGGLGGTAAERP